MPTLLSSDAFSGALMVGPDLPDLITWRSGDGLREAIDPKHAKVTRWPIP
jgi:hypothetical protein